jgi:plasmid maintenance system antidote protein VapI
MPDTTGIEQAHDAWPYHLPPLPEAPASDAERAAAALAYAQECCQEHGAQTKLALLVGIPRLHMRTILTGERLASGDIAARLEAVLGIPAAWWPTRRPRKWALVAREVRSGRAAAARQQLAVRKASAVYPLHLRLRIDEAALDALIDGTVAPDAAMRSRITEQCKEIPEHLWDE